MKARRTQKAIRKNKGPGIDRAVSINRALSISVDRLFHALGDPTRRAILDRLTAGPASVSGLADPLGVTLTAVAQHLQILEEVRLVHTEKLGRVRTCRIEPAGFRALEQWIRDHRTAWERKLDRLGQFLASEDLP